MSVVQTDQIQESTVGNGVGILSNLHIDDSTNVRMGTAILAAGTLVVANTSVTALTRVFMSRATQGAGPGFLSYVVNAGVGFTITSSSGTDTGNIDWVLIEPV